MNRHRLSSTNESSPLQPLNEIVHSSIWWKDRIPPFDDPPTFDSNHRPLQDLRVIPFECRQVKGLLKGQILVTEQVIRQMKPGVDLGLICRRLSRDTIDGSDSQGA